MNLFIVIVILTLLSLPVGIYAARRMQLTTYAPIAALGFAIYAVDAYLVAALMMIGEETGTGLVERTFDVLRAGTAGIVVFSPFCVPLILALAFVVLKMQRSRVAEPSR